MHTTFFNLPKNWDKRLLFCLITCNEFQLGYGYQLDLLQKLILHYWSWPSSGKYLAFFAYNLQHSVHLWMEMITGHCKHIIQTWEWLLTKKPEFSWKSLKMWVSLYYCTGNTGKACHSGNILLPDYRTKKTKTKQKHMAFKIQENIIYLYSFHQIY